MYGHDFSDVTVRRIIQIITRTLLFYTHFSQISYQIKANTPTHMVKKTEIFLSLNFFEVDQFISGEAKLFLASLFEKLITGITILVGRRFCD